MTATKDTGQVEGFLGPVLTAAQLGAIFPKAPRSSLELDAAELSRALIWAGCTTVKRIAAFLGQIGHECGELRYVREVWGPSAQQVRYENNAAFLWSAISPTNHLAFKLGNSEVGDGYRFRGWGWIQTTGRANTLAASLAIYGDDRLIARPDLLDQRATAPWGAASYWRARNLNALADADDDRGLTRAVNGAATDQAPSHHLRRMAYQAAALAVFGV